MGKLTAVFTSKHHNPISPIAVSRVHRLFEFKDLSKGKRIKKDCVGQASAMVSNRQVPPRNKKEFP